VANERWFYPKLSRLEFQRQQSKYAEYLAAHRYEAEQLPQTVTSHIDPRDFDAQRTDYVPVQDEDMVTAAECIPSHRWLTEFLADFAGLRGQLHRSVMTSSQHLFSHDTRSTQARTLSCIAGISCIVTVNFQACHAGSCRRSNSHKHGMQPDLPLLFGFTQHTQDVMRGHQGTCTMCSKMINQYCHAGRRKM